MKRDDVALGEIYHVLNRGVDRRVIFRDDQDRARFVHYLFAFNDTGRVGSNLGRELDSKMRTRRTRELLVDVLAFCLMPNHFHLLLRPRKEGGLTAFMRKLGVGYAKYFNVKNKRTGSLFQGPYKLVHMRRNEHLEYVPYYIHFNALDGHMPYWREGAIDSADEALQHLEKYRWSSHLDYTGRSNFPSVTQRDFLLDALEGEDGYKNSVDSWLRGMDMHHFRRFGKHFE